MKSEAPDIYSSWADVSASALQPNYGNITSRVGPDGVEVTNEFDRPHFQEQTGANFEMEDPDDPMSDITMATELTYEGSGTGEYSRQIEATKPSGDVVETDYYGANGLSATADDPCQEGTQSIHQGGLVAKVTNPDPDGGGPDSGRVDEFVYDAAGRPIAERVSGEGWTCTTYDDRGRPTEVTIPANDDYPARTLEYSYSVGGNPLISSVNDTAAPFYWMGTYSPTDGTSYTAVDILGRTVGSQDIWSNQTFNTYDSIGRLEQSGASDFTGVGPG